MAYVKGLSQCVGLKGSHTALPSFATFELQLKDSTTSNIISGSSEQGPQYRGFLHMLSRKESRVHVLVYRRFNN